MQETTERSLPPGGNGCPSNKTWRDAASRREVSARLEALPEEVEFHDSFPDPIYFDRRQKKLFYRGLMSSSSYKHLRSLSKNPDYLVAIDELFTKSAASAGRRKVIKTFFLWVSRRSP